MFDRAARREKQPQQAGANVYLEAYVTRNYRNIAGALFRQVCLSTVLQLELQASSSPSARACGPRLSRRALTSLGDPTMPENPQSWLSEHQFRRRLLARERRDRHALRHQCSYCGKINEGDLRNCSICKSVNDFIFSVSADP